ncbi:helix-turn-helix domain-containing protein [Streptomyces sp. NPDC047880]|uniref:transcriptional regulator n=1 Tax=Streptomyces sp. NPDC047880 TaxID=3155626 RepID=UPI003451B77D
MPFRARPDAEDGGTVSARSDVDDVGEFAALLRTLKERTDRSYGSLARRLAMNTSTLHRYCAGEAVPVDFAPVERFAALCGASPEERLELHRRWLQAVAARQRPRTASAAAAAEENAVTAEAAKPEAEAGTAALKAELPEAEESPVATRAEKPGAEEDTVDARAEEPEGEGDAVAARAEEPEAQEDTVAAGAEEPEAQEDTVAARAEEPEGEGDAVAAGAEERGGEEAVAAGGAVAAAAPVGVGGPAYVGSPLPRRPWYRRGRVAVGLAAACAVLAALGSLAALPDGRRASADDRARSAGPVPSGAAGAGAPRRESASPTPSDSSPIAEPPSPSATPEKKKPSPSSSARITPPPAGAADPAVPLTWSADSHAWELGCGHDYVVARPPDQVAPPPAPQDAAVWAAAQNAVHGGETLVQLSVQGRTDTAVVLEALRVRVVGRTAPAQGNAYAMDRGCGGSITPRSFDVNLDKDRPIARAVAGSDAGTPIPAVRMPYRVSARDPEVLLVNARTQACDCRWYLELDWSSQGRRGTVRIDDDGHPFRTSGIKGLPRYVYDTSARAWTPYS